MHILVWLGFISAFVIAVILMAVVLYWFGYALYLITDMYNYIDHPKVAAGCGIASLICGAIVAAGCPHYMIKPLPPHLWKYQLVMGVIGSLIAAFVLFCGPIVLAEIYDDAY